MRRTTLLAVCTIALALCVGHAQAQVNLLNSFTVNYFSNAHTAGAPDGTVRITNPGQAGGNVCSNIFVFDPSQELSECCACLNTPDGLATLSVNTDLTGNPLTGVTLTTGSIYVIGTLPVAGVCPLPYNANSTLGDLWTWVTHIQNSNFSITETPSDGTELSAGEFARLKTECSGIVQDGSKKGICTCGVGD
jgi:hypothetical protein